MDEHSSKLIAGLTQRLLAERLRQRYASCREALESRASGSRAQAEPTAVSPPPFAVKTAGHEESVALPSPASAERFSTLFSQAYSAARHSQDQALATLLDLGRRNLAA